MILRKKYKSTLRNNMPKVWKPSVYAGSQTFFRLRDIIMTVFLEIGACFDAEKPYCQAGRYLL